MPNAEILSSIPPDEVISIGCANQAIYVGDEGDEDGEQIELEIPILPTDIQVNVVDANNESLTEPISFFTKGTTVPSAHGVSIPISAKAPVKLAVRQGDHVEYIDGATDVDLNEITARVHGGIRLNNQNAKTTEPASIHLHLN